MRRSTAVLLIVFIIIVDLVTFIFCNSLEEQKVSAEKSTGLLKYIVEIMDIEGNQEEINKVHGIIRKIAHGIEFTALGVLLAAFFRGIEKRKGRKYICFPVLIGLLVGIADEYIQSFNDRSSEIADVLIDFGGIVVGVSVTMLIFAGIDRRRRAARIKNDYEEGDDFA